MKKLTGYFWTGKLDLRWWYISTIGVKASKYGQSSDLCIKAVKKVFGEDLKPHTRYKVTLEESNEERRKADIDRSKRSMEKKKTKMGKQKKER